MDVAVVVRSTFEDLSVLVPVAPGDLDESRRLEDEVTLRPLGREAVGRPARNDDVVTVLVGNVAERGLERPRALVHEDHLVAFAVPEEVVHLRIRPAERDLDVRVPHEGAAARDLVPARCDVVGVHPPVRVRLRHPLLALDRRERSELLDAARRLQVVQDRFVPGEPLEAHDLLGQKPSVLAEHDVTLARHVAAALVEGHGRPFRVGWLGSGAPSVRKADRPRSGRRRRPVGERRRPARRD